MNQNIDLFTFKVYVANPRKLESVQESIEEIEIGDLEWGGFEVKREGGKDLLEITATMSPKFGKRVDSRIRAIPGVVNVKASGGAPKAVSNKADDVCSSDLLIEEGSIPNYDSVIEYAIGQLQCLKGFLPVAKEGNIRGRLVVQYDGELCVGSTFSVIGKVRYHETDYPLNDATGIVWYASRANQCWKIVSYGASYTPIAEDAGKKITIVFNHKGTTVEYEPGCVRVNQELENTIGLLLKKKKALSYDVHVNGVLNAEEQSRAGRKEYDSVAVTKKGVQLFKGGRMLYNEEHGAAAIVRSIRGHPSEAIIQYGERALPITFSSSVDCITFVLACRAYSAYDTLCLIASLPPVDKQVQPDVSIVNAIIQAGSAVQPFTWEEVNNVVPAAPEVDEKEIAAVGKVLKALVASRRLRASTQSILTGVLAAISQGSIAPALPKESAWNEPESEEEPEEEEPAMLGNEDSQNWSIDEASIEKYGEMYSNSAKGTILKLEACMELFRKSGQEDNVILQVVGKVCLSNKQIQEREFVVVIHVLRLLKKGYTMFDSLPASLRTVLGRESSPMKTETVELKSAKSMKSEKMEKSPKSMKMEKSPKSERKEKKTREEPEEEEEEVKVNEVMVKKIRASFAKEAEGESEIGMKKAMRSFQKSELKPKDIASIVMLVCNGKPDSLTENQFVACTVLIQHVRKGNAIPKSIPGSVAPLLEEKKMKKNVSMKSKSPKREAVDDGEEDWTLDKETFTKLGKMFKKQTDGEDTMAPALALKKFKESGIDDDTIKSAIKLVLKGKGPITLGQFAVIMFLLMKIKKGAELPPTLPSQLKRFI